MADPREVLAVRRCCGSKCNASGNTGDRCIIDKGPRQAAEMDIAALDAAGFAILPKVAGEGGIVAARQLRATMGTDSTPRDRLAASLTRAGFHAAAQSLTELVLAWLSEPQQIEAIAEAQWNARGGRPWKNYAAGHLARYADDAREHMRAAVAALAGDRSDG